MSDDGLIILKLGDKVPDLKEVSQVKLQGVEFGRQLTQLGLELLDARLLQLAHGLSAHMDAAVTGRLSPPKRDVIL